MAVTLEQEQAEHAETKARLADVMGDGGSYRKLQVELDESLQRHADKDKLHAKAIAELQTAHAAEVNAIKQSHAADMDSLRESHAAALSQQEKDLLTKHAAEIAELKANTMLPALHDLHARQAADLAAQHAAQLALVQ